MKTSHCIVAALAALAAAGASLAQGATGYPTRPVRLVVHPSVPAKTVSEFIAWVKDRPGEVTYASTGVGSSPRSCAARWPASTSCMPPTREAARHCRTFSPADFAALIKSEIPKWAKVMKAAGIEPE